MNGLTQRNRNEGRMHVKEEAKQGKKRIVMLGI